MKTLTQKKIISPYVPYSTFTNFINGLKKTGVPSHIDKSIMLKMSGSGQSAMMAALKSLKLINSASEPKEKLIKLINSSESEYSTIMADIVRSCYDFIINDSFPIGTTTSKKVEDKFRELGATGSTLTKCIAFFLAAAKAANIKVSAHVKAPTIQRSSTPKKKNQQQVKQKGNEDPRVPSPKVNKDMELITVPLPGMSDGQIYFPKDMSDEEAKLAVLMADFILNKYYKIKED